LKQLAQGGVIRRESREQQTEELRGKTHVGRRLILDALTATHAAQQPRLRELLQMSRDIRLAVGRSGREFRDARRAIRTEAKQSETRGISDGTERA
jgi:hypothetical protein